MESETQDINGAAVRVGTRVKVLKIPPAVLAELPASEAECARSMQGEVFEVTEVDEWGGAWVKKMRRGDDGLPTAYSLGIGPGQMEVAP